jgi:hypothetical protein
MGYSCTALAMDTFKTIFKNDKSSNVHNGYMYEIGRKNRDGAVTGTAWKFIPDGRIERAGSFKVTSDGFISSMPGITKEEKREAMVEAYLKFVKIYGKPTHLNKKHPMIENHKQTALFQVV